MKNLLTRRSFMRHAALGSACITLLKNSSSAFTYAANDKIGTAHIGVGGRGRELLLTFQNMTNLVAFADVNDAKATEMYRRFPDVPKFKDFRVMLDKLGRQIDAVAVATPDHTHAVASATAIKAGKHVYTEKPLTRLVQESRTLRQLARQYKVATSMGNQGTAAGPFRRAMELIQSGAIGQIREVHVWNDSGGSGQKQPPSEAAKVPPYLDWDLWLGTARSRPFHPRWMAWHTWRDFGTCQLGNWGSHTANLAFRSLRVDSLWSADPASKPILRVEAKADQINHLAFPRWEMITWQIPARGELPPIPFYWYNGSRAPGMRDKLEALLGRGLDWGDKGEKKWADFAGCLIVGSDGMIHATGHNATFTMLPEEKFRNLQQGNPEKLPRSLGHERDWLAACRGGAPAWANYDYAAPLNEFLQLGNLATQVEGPIDYDPLTGQITNNKDANSLLSSEYRSGWSL
jgi:hypothetical protein